MEVLVSVCITAYNLESYLFQAIEGVLMQITNFPFEIIIGNDASIDKTKEICLFYQKKYPDKIKLVLHEKNVGVAKNDISVVKVAQGKYIAWCDGDDYWIDNQKLQKQYDVLEKRPDVSLVHTDWLNLYEEENKTRETRIKVKEIEKTSSGRQAIELFVLRETTGCRFSSCMFRKSYYIEALENFPELFLSGHVNNDFAVFIAMCERGKFFHIPEVSTVYRIRKESLSISQSEEKRFRYSLGYLKLISHVINYYSLDEETKNIAIRSLLDGLLKYTLYNKKTLEVEEIGKIIEKMNYNLSFSQKFLYIGSNNRFFAFFLRPFFAINYYSRKLCK